MKVEARSGIGGCAGTACAAILAALVLSGCAIAMLGGAARSGGSAPAPSSTGAGAGSASAPGKPASQAALDSSISTAVRSRLGASATVKALKIVVDTHDGIVTLRGQVNTVEQRNAAEVEARAVNGVRAVNNQLTVRPGRAGVS